MKIKLKSKHNFLRHALAGAASLAMLAGTATAATTSICDPDGGYVVAYYNGTMALPDDADAQRAAMRRARHGVGPIEKINGEAVHYETFYSANTTQLQALATTYRQSLDGVLSSYWEYFWDFLGGDASVWAALAAKTGDTRFVTLGSSFPAQVTSQAAAALSEMKAAVPTSTTLGNFQKARALALYGDSQRLLLVSQGDHGALFADQGFAAIAANNSTKRLSLSARPGSDASALTSAMASLERPTNLVKGFFTATLSWSVPAGAYSMGESDFDLHVIEPTPPVADESSYVQWVHFGATNRADKGGGGPVSLQGYSGYLNKDYMGTSVTDIGPEKYYATCDSDRLLPGKYWVSVTRLRAPIPDQTSITLQIATAKSGEVYSKTFRYNDLLGFEQQTKLSFPVMIELKKDSDGNWAKPVITPYAPFASYESTGLPTTKL